MFPTASHLCKRGNWSSFKSKFIMSYRAKGKGFRWTLQEYITLWIQALSHLAGNTTWMPHVGPKTLCSLLIFSSQLVFMGSNKSFYSGTEWNVRLLHSVTDPYTQLLAKSICVTRIWDKYVCFRQGLIIPVLCSWMRNILSIYSWAHLLVGLCFSF